MSTPPPPALPFPLGMSAMQGIIELLRAVVAREDAEVLAERLGGIRLVVDATLPTSGRIYVTPGGEDIASVVVHFDHVDHTVTSLTMMTKPDRAFTSVSELRERFGKYSLGERTGARGPREVTFLVEVDVRSDRIGIVTALVFNDREPVEKWRIAGLTIAHAPRV